MKIPNTDQVRKTDAYTIEHEPVASIDLMERAALQLYRQWVNLFTSDRPVEIFAGPGNNGGDGIALARMLADKGYQVKLWILKNERKLSPDAQINYQRLPVDKGLSVEWLNDELIDNINPDPKSILVDAIFGSGLTRVLSGFIKDVVRRINSFSNTKVAVDIPSGLFAEDNPHKNQTIIKADYTWCFQFPKLAFLMPENDEYIGEWKFLDIGLHQGFIDSLDIPYLYITRDYACSLIHSRTRFSHKGDFGHSLLFAGGEGKMGAAILASRSCLRSGVGLHTCRIPSHGMEALHTSVPEAMLSLDKKISLSSIIPLSSFDAVGAGPGIGMAEETSGLIEELLEGDTPLVLDADALNIIAENKNMLDKIPAGTILTPHPGEYKRLFGDDNNQFDRINRMMEISARLQVIIVLKGANTAIASPDGKIWFNSTGNPGMATAGSGDVLTGIILSLLAQAYSPVEAAILGTYVHGLAGDIAANEKGYEGLIATDIIECLPAAFNLCK